MKIFEVEVDGEMVGKLRSAITKSEMERLFEDMILAKQKQIESTPDDGLPELKHKIQAVREIKFFFLKLLDKP